VEKIDEVRIEIDRLDRLRKKLRISTTLASIAVRTIYTRRIAQAMEERKTVSMSFWHGRRAFEEDWADLHGDLVALYGKLGRGETERDRLRGELTEMRKETGKLEHWRDLQVRAYDRMDKEERALLKVCKVDVTALLVRLTDAHTELDSLTGETDALEEAVNLEIREPMAEADALKRQIQLVQVDTLELRRHSSRAPRPSEVLEVIKEKRAINAKLVEINADLRRRIEEQENAIAAMKPDERENMIELVKEVPKNRAQKKVFVPEIPVRPTFAGAILPRIPYV
jgi:hypothetical protein